MYKYIKINYKEQSINKMNVLKFFDAQKKTRICLCIV